MHQGLYMIKLNADLTTIEQIKEYSESGGFKSLSVNVFLVDNRVVFSDGFSLYLFDDINNRIVPYEDVSSKLGIYAGANRIIHQKSSIYWFVRNEGAALVDLSANKTRIIDKIQFSLFQNQTVDNYQNVVPISDDVALFTLENGMALYQLNAKSRSHQAAKKEIQFMEILVLDKKSEEKMLLPINSDTEKIFFPHTKNRIRFTVSYPNFSFHNNLMFSYKLSWLNSNWNEKTTNNQKEYSYLVPGNYVFSVQALTNNGEALATKDYHFRVRPPFYWNTFSKILYLLIILTLAYLGYYFIKRSFDTKKQKIKQEQESIRMKEIEKREQEIVALKTGKLEAELNLKSKELAMSTMTIINKNEVLLKIKEELVELKRHLGSQYPNKYYDKMIRLVDQNIASEDDWNVFQTNFDRIHENFFRNLHEKYPQLTSNDLRFCAYFRLNLPTKDIAQLMNISPKGVEVARYRIRKKINIPSDKNISEFMIEFK